MSQFSTCIMDLCHSISIFDVDSTFLSHISGKGTKKSPVSSILPSVWKIAPYYGQHYFWFLIIVSVTRRFRSDVCYLLTNWLTDWLLALTWLMWPLWVKITSEDLDTDEDHYDHDDHDDHYDHDNHYDHDDHYDQLTMLTHDNLVISDVFCYCVIATWMNGRR